jgi:GxxExxY protein
MRRISHGERLARRARMAVVISERIIEITGRIIAAAIEVHRRLGPGLLESAYRACLLFELHRRGFRVVAAVPVPIVYDNVRINCGYELDLLVDDLVVLELKSVNELARIHQAQLLTYLKLTGYPVGLLINFNEELLVHGVKRMVNPNPDPRFEAALEKK